MKKHHIFLLIISCLIAASFMFPGGFNSPESVSRPTGTQTKKETKYPKNPAYEPIEITADSTDDIPSRCLPGDTVNLKTKMNQFSVVKYYTLDGNPKIFKEGSQKDISAQTFQKILINTSSDDAPEEYMRILMPETPGEYILELKLKPGYTNGLAGDSIITHKFTVCTPTAAAINEIHINGDDGA